MADKKKTAVPADVQVEPELDNNFDFESTDETIEELTNGKGDDE